MAIIVNERLTWRDQAKTWKVGDVLELNPLHIGRARVAANKAGFSIKSWVMSDGTARLMLLGDIKGHRKREDLLTQLRQVSINHLEALVEAARKKGWVQ